MAKKSYDLLFKLLLIGDSGVGKTCLLLRYCDNIYSSNFISTIGIDFKIKTVEIAGKRIKLQIWDTAGQERFQTITTSYYRGAMGIMLVYDVTNRKSFDNVSKWVNCIQQHAQDNVEKMLVANKCDDEARRIVTAENGLALSRAHHIPIFEASAKTGDNVTRAFEELTLAILDKMPATTTSPNNAAGGGGGKLVQMKNDQRGRSCCQ